MPRIGAADVRHADIQARGEDMGEYAQDKIYAIQHKRTGRFITGTDFSVYPRKHIFSKYNPPLLIGGIFMECEIRHRNINFKEYRVVEVQVQVSNG